MKIDRLLNTPMGKIFISILLGLGLATMFRKVCKDKNCIVFHGPVISEVDGKTFKHGEDCYQYKTKTVPCDEQNKQVLDIRPPDMNEDGSVKIDPIPAPTRSGGSIFSSFMK
jgi:hypothetical protein